MDNAKQLRLLAKLRKNWAVTSVVVVLLALNLILFWRPGGPKRVTKQTAMSPLSPLPLRLQLLETLQREDTLESIRRLPDFDDSVWALGPANGDDAYGSLSYTFDVMFVDKLNRVKKIIKEVRSGSVDRTIVATALKDQFSKAIIDFETVNVSKSRSIATSQIGVTLVEPDDYWKKTVTAPATAFLLAELEVVDALPLLADAFNSADQLPVSRLFLFYCMHLLAEQHPRANLQPDSLKLLDDYLNSAAAVLGTSTQRQVSTGLAQFESHDLRRVYLKREIPDVEKITIHTFPLRIAEHEARSSVDEPILTRVGTLIKFIRSVYSSQ